MKKNKKITNYKVIWIFCYDQKVFNILIFLLSVEQSEALEEENRQVHNTNNSTIERLQILETTTTQLQVNQ